jgi:hypothetical protein
LKFARGKNLTQVTSIVDIQTNRTNPDYSWVIEEVEKPTRIRSLLPILLILLLL